MNIVNKIKKMYNKRVMSCFAIWAISSLALTPIYVYQFEFLYNIDIISHIGFGLLFGAIFLEILKVNESSSPSRLFASFVFCLAFFILWEYVEIFMTIMFPVEQVINLFAEPLSNRVQDMFMDVAGYIAIASVYVSGGVSVTINIGKGSSRTYSL